MTPPGSVDALVLNDPSVLATRAETHFAPYVRHDLQHVADDEHEGEDSDDHPQHGRVDSRKSFGLSKPAHHERPRRPDRDWRGVGAHRSEGWHALASQAGSLVRRSCRNSFAYRKRSSSYRAPSFDMEFCDHFPSNSVHLNWHIEKTKDGGNDIPGNFHRAVHGGLAALRHVDN